MILAIIYDCRQKIWVYVWTGSNFELENTNIIEKCSENLHECAQTYQIQNCTLWERNKSTCKRSSPTFTFEILTQKAHKLRGEPENSARVLIWQILWTPNNRANFCRIVDTCLIYISEHFGYNIRVLGENTSPRLKPDSYQNWFKYWARKSYIHQISAQKSAWL